MLDASVLATVTANRTIFVAPPEVFAVPYRQHKDVLARIHGTTTRFLEDNGYEVLPVFRFREEWKACEAEIGGLFDSRSGEFDADRVDRCFSETVRRLARSESFSAVLIPSVEYQNLALEPPYRKATWDGVRRRVQFDGGLTRSRWLSVLGMTLRPRLITVSGELAYEGAGGLDFAQKTVAEDGEIHLVPKVGDDFDPRMIEEGVALALGPLVDA